MYEEIEKTTPKAKKVHTCIWCCEKILIGEKYVREKSKYDGEFQDHKWHPECWDACAEYISETGESEFNPYENLRGEIPEDY